VIIRVVDLHQAVLNKHTVATIARYDWEKAERQMGNPGMETPDLGAK